jgi:hypothetical protein
MNRQEYEAISSSASSEDSVKPNANIVHERSFSVNCSRLWLCVLFRCPCDKLSHDIEHAKMRRCVVAMFDSKEIVGICLKELDRLCNGKSKGRCEILGEIIL